jgi:hypothetical protein
VKSRLAAASEVAPVAFAVVAEGAWVTVASSLVQTYALVDIVIGLPAMIVIAAAGAILARLVAPRAGDRWPILASGLTIAAGTAGWLVAPDVRAALAAGLPVAALGANPGGWFAGLALLRGFRHSRLPLDESSLALVLGLGIPGLAFAAIAGGMIAEPFRGRFLAETLVAATIFAASATLALALARLTAVGADAGFDWRRNPPWILLVGLLVAAVAVVAQPASAIAGPLIPIGLGIVAGPLLVVAFVLGFSRRAAWLIFIAAGVTIVYVGLVALFSQGPPSPQPAVGDVGPGVEAAPPGDEVLAGAALLIVAAAVSVAILVRLWMRRSRDATDDPSESRTIDRGDAIGRPRGLRRRRVGWRRPDPVDAVSAYRAIDEELRPTPLARRPGETPTEHARRLRTGRTGASALALDLLAADYALARFGGVSLSGAEERRAVERWRVLRRTLRERTARLGR